MSNVIAFPQKTYSPKEKITSTTTPIDEPTGVVPPLYFQKLQRDMKQDLSRSRRNVRTFRQRFCFLARINSGLSQKELCLRLNSHSEIQNLSNYPCFNTFYPITAEFLNSLETNITSILEYNGTSMSWLFGGLGVPTDKLAKVIANICKVDDEYEQFLQSSSKYQHDDNLWQP